MSITRKPPVTCGQIRYAAPARIAMKTRGATRPASREPLKRLESNSASAPAPNTSGGSRRLAAVTQRP